MKIEVLNLGAEELERKGVRSWPIWEKEVSRFEWFYDMEEACYILEGTVVVETEEETITIQKGDYVVFPKGLACVWDIKADIRKHYSFS